MKTSTQRPSNRPRPSSPTCVSDWRRGRLTAVEPRDVRILADTSRVLGPVKMATTTRELTVSVLNLNQAALTIDVVEKLASLSARDWLVQLILVDNGSRPGELQPLQEWVSANRDRFEELLFISASRNLGATGGRNLAFQLASKDRILILDNDVVLPDDSAWLDKLWRTMDGESRAAIVAPMLVFADASDTVQATGIGLTREGRVGYVNRHRKVTSIEPVAQEVVATPTACWLLRRAAQRAVGLFSAAFYPVQYEDVDLCIRLRLEGWKTICDRAVALRHIENVTTRNLDGYPFARLTVRNGMSFNDKWAALLPEIASMTQDEISWGP